MPDEEAPTAADSSACETSINTSSTAKVAEHDEVSNGIRTVGGFDRMAKFMANDSSHAITRGFAYLNSLNLLYFQAELVALERELDVHAKHDANGADPCRNLYDRHWFSFSRHKVEPNSTNKTTAQWDTVLRLRDVLKQYNEAILAQSNIAKLTKPTKGDFNYVQAWTDRADLGHIDLLAPGQNVWHRELIKDDLHMKDDPAVKDKSPFKDMISVSARGFDDALSRWITSYVISRYHKAIGRFYRNQEPTSDLIEGNATHYSNRGVLRIVSLTTMSLASLFPIVSIIVLNFVTDIIKRLGLIVVFTVAFSFCLGLFSAGRKAEIFSAAAAFAAVQVVFIRGDD